GYITPYMVTDRQRMEAVFDKPAILLTNQTISQVQELMPAVEAARRIDRPLVIIAEDVDGPALQMLTAGIMHDTFSS
ncbi:molecular chaperone GroEL, partial [Mycobacterium tuberculosis]|nr:molecular chaperone GroEL [Mycobacterium tuberculosis]